MLISNYNRDIHFVTLKLSDGMNGSGQSSNLFSKGDFCDEFIKTLIYCIETRELKLFGFVILSNQVHLIISSAEGDVEDKIKELKYLSSKEVIALIKRKLFGGASHAEVDIIELRRFFSLYLNHPESQIWHDEHLLTALEMKKSEAKLSDIQPEVLVAHLGDKQRNYLQLGAAAFTKLMIESI